MIEVESFIYARSAVVNCERISVICSLPSHGNNKAVDHIVFIVVLDKSRFVVILLFRNTFVHLFLVIKESHLRSVRHPSLCLQQIFSKSVRRMHAYELNVDYHFAVFGGIQYQGKYKNDF